MKNIFLILTAFVLISISALAQPVVAFSDTMGNSQSREYLLDITDLPDSVTISLFCRGEIDLDSLDVKFGHIEKVPYKGGLHWINTLATSTTYSKVLTIDLNSSTESYTANVVTIPKSALKGYNSINFKLTAGSSGNVGTSPQKAVLIIYQYKS